MAFAPPSHASPIQTTVLFALEMACAATTAACAILAFEVDIVKEQRNLVENQQSILKSILSYFFDNLRRKPSSKMQAGACVSFPGAIALAGRSCSVHTRATRFPATPLLNVHKKRICGNLLNACYFCTKLAEQHVPIRAKREVSAGVPGSTHGSLPRGSSGTTE